MGTLISLVQQPVWSTQPCLHSGCSREMCSMASQHCPLTTGAAFVKVQYPT